ncbi:MAG TPA: hypothetical protein VMB73_26505 [Acetobacteraceae bacterium]|nr:hypothetical protein [Acetobacteraceae bacterium]
MHLDFRTPAPVDLDVQTWRLRLGEHSAAYGFNQIASTMAELEHLQAMTEPPRIGSARAIRAHLHC